MVGDFRRGIENEKAEERDRSETPR